MESKHKIIVFLVAIFLGGVFWYLYGVYTDRSVSNPSPDAVTVAPVSDQQDAASEPPAAEVSNELPAEFPTDIPIEADVRFSQNFTVTAEGQQQMTIVFPSKASIKDNHALYTQYLKDKGWTVTNSYESEMLSSLYATRENSEINVTVSVAEPGANETKSQVSISVLKK